MTTTAIIISVPHRLLLVPKQHPCSQTSPLLHHHHLQLRLLKTKEVRLNPNPTRLFLLVVVRHVGKMKLRGGCNGEGRIQGGIATVPGFGWWPIKAYRPCPEFVASGGRYRRQGQSMDEVAGFGRVEKAASMRASDEPQSSKKNRDPKIQEMKLYACAASLRVPYG